VLHETTETAWMPWYYPIFKAAKECNCKPWELLEQSVFWRDAAIKVVSAEAQAQKIIDGHHT